VNTIQIPSPVQRINHTVFRQAEVDVFLKRDDLIHPAISGNKWRKLKYNLEAIKDQKLEGFITFGGAYSNHLAAAAYAGKQADIDMIALVRGEIDDMQNPTLNFVKACGMQLQALSRAAYKSKADADFLMQLQAQYPKHLIIPEGGANLFGVRGCIEILEETDFTPEIVVAPLGSATTFTGLVLSAKPQSELWGFPAVKGGAYLRNTVNNFITKAKETGLVPATFPSPKWQLITSYHFGGFAKTTPAFIHFLNAFYAETGIPLDPIYSGKMMYGLLEEIKAGRIKPGGTVLVLHTGGLQGISGMNQRLRKKNLQIEYEEAIARPFPDPPH
jgi:1-aminocyclopropane-1-carboxylate deaminase